MFTLRAATRAHIVRPSAGLSSFRNRMGISTTSRRFGQQGYGDDADASIADTPEARKERSGQDQSSEKQGGSGNKSNQPQESPSNGTKKSSSSKDTAGAQPKILSDSPPQEGEESPEVRKHNEELAQRADKAHEKVKDKDVEKDKVDKRFWSGHGGVDKDP